MTDTRIAGADHERAILDALEGLAADAPLHAISIDDIIASAGVARATFYFYFAGKSEAFGDIAEVALEAVATAVGELAADAALRSPAALTGELLARVTGLRRHRGVLRIAIEEWPRDPVLQTRYAPALSRIHASIAQAMEEDRVRLGASAGLPTPVMASVFLWAAERSLHDGLVGAPGLDDARTVAASFAATYLALVADGGSSPELIGPSA